MAEEGVYTLRNYGKRRNCSVSILSPQFVQVLTMNVCVTRRTSSTQHIRETNYFEEVILAAYFRNVKLPCHLNFTTQPRTQNIAYVLRYFIILANI